MCTGGACIHSAMVALVRGAAQTAARPAVTASTMQMRIPSWDSRRPTHDSFHGVGGLPRFLERPPMRRTPELRRPQRCVRRGGTKPGVRAPLSTASRFLLPQAPQAKYRQPSGWRLNDQLAAPIPSGALESDGPLAQTSGLCASGIDQPTIWHSTGLALTLVHHASTLPNKRGWAHSLTASSRQESRALGRHSPGEAH